MSVSILFGILSSVVLFFQVKFGTDQDDRDIGSVVINLRVPLYQPVVSAPCLQVPVTR